MTEQVPMTVVYETVEGGWTQARIAQIPEIITVAPSREEARTYVLDALREYLLSLTERQAKLDDGPDSEPLALTLEL
mgnify:CR=1 FL=1